MLSKCSKFDLAHNKFDVKMVAPSVVEEAGDYILNVDMFQFVWWNIDHLDNFYFFDFQYLPNDLVI